MRSAIKRGQQGEAHHATEPDGARQTRQLFHFSRNARMNWSRSGFIR